MKTPINAVTMKSYSGTNAFILGSSSFADNRFMTFLQAKTLGRKVRKGEQGITIRRVVIVRELDRATAKMKPKKTLKFFTVFNWDQTETV